MYWSPCTKISFSNEELIARLIATHECPERRVGNWWTFFSHLAHPEQDRLNQQVVHRLSPKSTPAMWTERHVGAYRGL